MCFTRVTLVCVLCLSLSPVDFVSEGSERLQLWRTAQAQGCLYPLGKGPLKSLLRAARKVLAVPGNHQVPIKLTRIVFLSFEICFSNGTAFSQYNCIMNDTKWVLGLLKKEKKSVGLMGTTVLGHCL